MKRQGVILIQPPAYSKYPGMPMGMLYVASVLTDKFDVTCLDWNATPLSINGYKEFVSAIAPLAVIIGGTSPSQPEAYAIARWTKEVCPPTFVIKGGPHETLCADRTAEAAEIDYVVRGAGEVTADLLVALEAGETPSRKIIDAPPPDASAFVALDRMLLFPKNPAYYSFLGPSTAQIRTTRGCVFHCSYCSQGAYLSYDLADIKDEVERVAAAGFEAIYWDDAIFTAHRERVRELLQYMRAHKFVMSCITRAGVNTDDALLGEMAETGFREIWFALESGSERMLKALGRKGVGVPEVAKAVQSARSAGLRTRVDIIVGSPGETDATVSETVEALKEIRPSGVSCSVYTRYPGAPDCRPELYERPINRDRRLMHFDEGYGGDILISPDQAEVWHQQMASELGASGIDFLGFEDCRTPRHWDLPIEPPAIRNRAKSGDSAVFGARRQAEAPWLGYV